MKVSKNKVNGILISTIFAISILTNLNAQHMGQGNMGSAHIMDQNTMQHMGQQMMNMQQMMNNLEGMMDRTSGMMDAMHDMNNMGDNGSGDHMNHDTYDMGAGHNMDDNGGNMGGNGGDMHGNGMMNMVQGMDEMTKDMQGFMNQMSTMMENEDMMIDPLMNQYMENMQEYMSTVMNGYDGIITQMEKIQILNTK